MDLLILAAGVPANLSSGSVSLVVREIREVGWQSMSVEECSNRFAIRQAALVSEGQKVLIE
jgi:hypothetical protein